MLHIHIPSLPQKSYEYRRGDSTVVYDDDKHAILIDGGEGDLWKKMRAFLESKGLQHVTFVLSHWHPDHDCALRSALESSYVIVDRIYCPPIWELNTIPDGTGDYRRAAAIIGLARNLGKEIVYLDAKNTRIKVGDIRAWLWRRKANKADYINYQVNNTSVCAYFPDLAYLSTGDTITSTENYLKRFTKRKVIGFKVPHHGNACSERQCDLLEARGAKICWYNDWEPSGCAIGGTNFSKYGARNCARRFTTLRPFQDIDVQSNGKTVVWKQGGKTWTFALVDEPKQEAPAQDQTQMAPKLRDMSTLFGIDTSYANVVDWDKVANEIDFAILQCGYGQDRTSQDDKRFKQSAEACERLGIPYGIYLYSYAKNSTMAEGEAKHALRLAKGRQLSLPIYYDLEESSLGGVAASNMRTFAKLIESAGYWCGVYSGEYYYSKNLSYITAFTRWIARYNSNNGKATTKPSTSNVAIWQYSSRGKVSGVNGNVDVNIMYVDLIKSITGKDYIQAARDVWAGKYGTNDERTQKLKAEGFDPRIVQHFVNRLKA